LSIAELASAMTVTLFSLLFSLLFLLPAVAVNPGGFPNSITGPLRGWRSWNAVFSDVNQTLIERQIDAVTARWLTVRGKKTSLADIGFNRVGIDSGWASCTGVNGSWHDKQGHFIINTTKFPNMRAMVDHGHSKGVLMGFYLNQDLDPGYHMCKSEGSIPGAAANTGNFRSYKLDSEGAAALGFDSVKFDNGGGNDNMTLWATAINATGRQMMLENSNNGGYVPYGAAGCPFNMFRVGSDNSPSPLTMVSNLLDVEKYLNVSRPGCWAYPDMLELGAPVVGKWAATSPRNGPYSPPRKSNCSATDATGADTGPRLSLEQGKAEFAAWCTVSAPLILGFDMGNRTEYDKWFPVVSNPLALEVQADWAGLAGKLLARATTNWTGIVPMGASCEGMGRTRPLPSWTVWGKPLSGGRWAVTAINTRPDQSAEVRVEMREMGLSGVLIETDVWSGSKVEVPPGPTWKVVLPKGAGSHRFVILGPKDARHPMERLRGDMIL